LNCAGSNDLVCVCNPDLEVSLGSQLDPPTPTHLPLLDQAPVTQFIGHRVESAQSIVSFVLGSAHDPPFVGGIIVLTFNCLPDKEVAEFSQVGPSGTLLHVPLFDHEPAIQFVGQPDKEHGTNLVVAEFSDVQIPPYNSL
jgi:hypothetical protein